MKNVQKVNSELLSLQTCAGIASASKLSLFDEASGIRTVNPCLWLEIFFEYTEGPEILDFYRQARRMLGDRLTHYDLGDGRRKLISARTEKLVPTWCENLAQTWRENRTYGRTKQYFIIMDRGAGEGSSSELCIMIWPRSVGSKPPDLRNYPYPVFTYPYSAVSCAIPFDHPLVLEGKLIDWIKGLDILSKCVFISGSCGIGLNIPLNFPSFEAHKDGHRHVVSAYAHYPGLDINAFSIGTRFGLRQLVMQPNGEMPLCRTFLKRVNWLSFINEKQIDLLCGQSPFYAQLQQLEGVRTHSLAHGMIIQAGDTPQIGDSEQGDFIPIYQSVARLLRPIRVESISGGFQLGLEDGAMDWLEAFDSTQ